MSTIEAAQISGSVLTVTLFIYLLHHICYVNSALTSNSTSSCTPTIQPETWGIQMPVCVYKLKKLSLT